MSQQLSIKAIRILMLFASQANRDWYGLEIMDELDISSGSLYPVLANFEGRGWLESDWENVDPKIVKRRPRRYYRLTPDGVVASQKVREEEVRPLARLAGVLAKIMKRLGSVEYV